MRDEKEKVFDAWLAASARLGDREALSLLAERWNSRLLAHAYRLSGERDLAADITQEAWTQIIRGIAGLDDADAFAAWAFRIVTRRCAHAIKGLQRRRRDLAAFAREPEPDPIGASTGERQIDLAAVQAAMQGLPRDQRAALALFYLEDLRVAEIAVALDVPVGTIKTRLMHARQKLRAKLQGDSK